MVALAHQFVMNSIVGVVNPRVSSSIGEMLNGRRKSNACTKLLYLHTLVKPVHSKIRANSSKFVEVSRMNKIIETNKFARMNKIIETADFEGPIPKDRLGELYSKFLEDLPWSNTKDLTEYSGLDEIHARFMKLVPTTSLSSNVIKASCGLSSQICSGRALEEQAKVSHGLALILGIDDLNSKGGGLLVEDMSLFHLRLTNTEAYKKLYPHRGPLHPTLEEMITHINSELSPHFPHQPRHQNTLIAGVLNLIEGCLLEHTYQINGLDCTPEMHLFPGCNRWKVGIPEVIINYMITGPEMVPGNYSSDTALSDDAFFYAKIHPMVPELCYLLCSINDVLSFYKENQAGETCSYILNLAKVKQISSYRALEETIAATIDCTRRVMIMAERSNSLRVQSTMVRFFQGFINWHLSWDSRYHLSELFGNDWYQGDDLF